MALLSFTPALHLRVFLAEIAPGFLPGPQANRINSLHLFHTPRRAMMGGNRIVVSHFFLLVLPLIFSGGQGARSSGAPGVLEPPKGLSHPECWLQSSSVSSGAVVRLCQGCRGALAAGASGELCELFRAVPSCSELLRAVLSCSEPTHPRLPLPVCLLPSVHLLVDQPCPPAGLPLKYQL